MKDNKEDDTVRYRYTLESDENSNNQRSISNGKNKENSEEKINILDNLNDCGDEGSIEEEDIDNYANKAKDINKKEKLNLNIFKFFENEYNIVNKEKDNNKPNNDKKDSNINNIKNLDLNKFKIDNNYSVDEKDKVEKKDEEEDENKEKTSQNFFEYGTERGPYKESVENREDKKSINNNSNDIYNTINELNIINVDKKENEYKSEKEIKSSESTVYKIMNKKSIVQKEHHNKSMDNLNKNIFEDLEKEKNYKNERVLSEKDLQNVIQDETIYQKKNINILIKNNIKSAEKEKNDKMEINKDLKDNIIPIKNEDIELTYLTKLSNLKNENNVLITENNKLKDKIEELNNIIDEKKKEIIESKALYDEINFEFDILNKKYENLMKKKGDNTNEKKILELKIKLKEQTDKNEELKNEIERKDTKSRNEINKLNQMMENLKLINEQMKQEYELLILKVKRLNQENFSLKKELFFYQNNNINPNLTDNNIRDIQRNNFQKEDKIDKIHNMKQYNFKKIANDKVYNNKNYNNKNIEDNEIITHTITNSHRKFIKNISQNDSSGVSTLLNIDINNQPSYNNKTKISTKNKYDLNDTYNKEFIKNNHNNSYLINDNVDNVDINKTYQNQKRFDKRGKIMRLKSIDNSNERMNYYEEKNFIDKRQSKLDNNFKTEKQIDNIEKELIKLQKQRNIYLNEFDKLPEHPKKQRDLNERKELKKLIEDLDNNINEYKRQERNIKKNYL